MRPLAMLRVVEEAMLAHYRAEHSLRETGAKFGINHETVRKIIKRDAPSMLRPVGRRGKSKKGI